MNTIQLFYIRLIQLAPCVSISIEHKDVKAIAQFVGTRNSTQVRTHAQKYFMKLVIDSSLSIVVI